MSLIASLRPLLKGSASVELVLAEEGGKLTALIKPKLREMDADTTDPEKARLQAALARPFKLVFSTDNPDAELALALSSMDNARSGSVDAMQRYIDDQAQARASAELARKKKAEAKSSTPSNGSSKVAPGAAKGKSTSGSTTEPAPLPAPLTDDTVSSSEATPEAGDDDADKPKFASLLL